MTFTAFEVPHVLLLLLGCAKTPPPPAARDVVCGTVSYRERIALPPEGVVGVKLSEVSRQAVAAPVIAETRVPSEGRQVTFDLRYHPANLRFVRIP